MPEINVPRLERLAEGLVREATQFLVSIDQYKRDPVGMLPQLEIAAVAIIKLQCQCNVARRTLGETK